MPGLDKILVEHLLLIKSEFHPFQQPPRRMSKEVKLKVKKEIGKLRVWVDFRDLNGTTLKTCM